MRSRYFAAVLLVSTGISLAHADNLRCGNDIVQTGDSQPTVRAKCGDPVDITHQSIARKPSYVKNGRVYYYGNEFVEVPVEIWTYNFGPNMFMRRLRFVGGLLEDIETLGYGYHEKR